MSEASFGPLQQRLLTVETKEKLSPNTTTRRSQPYALSGVHWSQSGGMGSRLQRTALALRASEKKLDIRLPSLV